MSSKRIAVVLAGVLLGIFMASMEATVVSTAMPTIVSQLGGLDTYSWVFSGYMLTSTTMVPLYGKFSDLFGRRRVFLVSMGFFLAGSVLCATATSMEQLIVYRLLQGLGAGGLIPLAFIIVGDIFSYEQRARMQGMFAGVWGVSSVVGPLLGGFLVDRVAWQWVFLINIPPCLGAAAVVWFGLPSLGRRAEGVRIDYAGAALMTAGIATLLLGLLEITTPLGWGLMALSALLLAALVWVERRAADPMLPLNLLRDRLFTVACLHGVFVGWAMFGTLSFVPLFVQAVVGTSATAAGSTLTPMMLGWVVSSVVGTRLLLRMPYRPLIMGAMALFGVGAFLLAQSNAGTSLPRVMLCMALMGIGMGSSVPIFLIIVQSAVNKRWLGVATSTLQFTRNIGGTIGVSVMGAALSLWLARSLSAAGVEASSVSLEGLLDPVAGSVAVDGALRAALGSALHGVFTVGFVAGLLAVLVTILVPGGRIGQEQARAAAMEQHLAGD